jgi:hypothetical protein
MAVQKMQVAVQKMHRDAFPSGGRCPSGVSTLSSVEHPEMGKWPVIELLVLHPLFDFNQTIVGSFDFLQYLLCVRILFDMCALLRKFRSFDVLKHPQ